MTTPNVVQFLTDRLVRRSFLGKSWGYTSPQFCAEPTCFALLALSDSFDQTMTTDCVRMLVNYQRTDGFWPTVDGGSAGSAWATAIAAVTLLELSPGASALHSAMKALAHSNPPEAFWLWRPKFRTIDTHARFDPNKYGWGWVPGTVSWVIPTAMALIALDRSRRLNLILSNELKRRIDLGHAMLLDRMCPGGGWNAGNSVVYGVPLTPHIDATANLVNKAAAFAAAESRQIELKDLQRAFDETGGADRPTLKPVHWDDLVLPLAVERDLRQLVRLMDAGSAERMQVPVPTGLLLVGPPEPVT